jgi:C1A family cysteine protease
VKLSIRQVGGKIEVVRKIQRYGWKRDLPDARDLTLHLTVQNLPAKVDLRPNCPLVYDQGEIGSCTANAIAGALEFDLLKERREPFTPSRLFIYYNERAMEGTVASDSGAELRDGCKSVASTGVCPEIQWPYSQGLLFVKPEAVCYQEARRDLARNYFRLPQGIAALKACLAAGYPFVFGFTVYDAFESDQVAKTGVLNLPGPHEAVLGGHAVMAIGYDDGEKRFVVRNSWGVNWGIKGYFTMPYDYVANPDLASDFWTLRRYA